MARIEGKYPTKALWIFCEGEKTEKNYFSKLRAQERIRRITIKVVNSDNTDAKGVVEHAIAFMKKAGILKMVTWFIAFLTGIEIQMYNWNRQRSLQRIMI